MAERNHDRPIAEEKSAAQIERDIDRTRAEIDDTLDRIFNRLTPGELFEQTIDYVRSSHGFTRFGTVLRDNPVPAVLAAVSIGWLIVAGLRARPEAAPARRPLPPPPRYAEPATTTAEVPRGESVAGSGDLAPSVAGGAAVERGEPSVTSTTSRTLEVESKPIGTPAIDRSS